MRDASRVEQAAELRQQRGRSALAARRQRIGRQSNGGWRTHVGQIEVQPVGVAQQSAAVKRRPRPSASAAPAAADGIPYPTSLRNDEGYQCVVCRVAEAYSHRIDAAFPPLLGRNSCFLNEYWPSNRFTPHVDPAKADAFRSAASAYLPGLAGAALVPDYAGIRPKLAAPGEAFRDFVIEETSARGVAGFVSCIGMESPGLTAALAIAERVAAWISP